jgi:hypothetical protein
MFKKRKHLYAISYCHERGFGCSQIYRDHKIKTIEDFNSILTLITQENHHNNVVILNIMHLGRMSINSKKGNS